MARTGRPSTFKPEYCEQAFKYALLGATDLQMAAHFGVSNQTFNNWKNKHTEFMDALKAGKDEANANVANSLYRQAMGYEIEEEEVRIVEGKPVAVKIKRFIPPNNAATIFFLKNRDRQNWRDKQEIEHSGHIEYSELTDEQLEQKIKELRSKG